MKSAATASRRGHGEDRRRALVAAAFGQIAERGFEGLRTREVAAEAGVNIATLHYYFPTKEALIRGVVAHAMERFRSTLAPHGSPDDQLGNHLKAVRALLRQEPEIAAVMGELALRSARDASLARIMRQSNDGWHRTLRALLHRAARAGNLAPSLDSDEAAALIVATLTSMVLPSMTPSRKDQAFRELERWLDSARPRIRSRSSN
ncbi:MAG TPA: TetR/AcrR family transcriptional regulator [Candidatus Dormibacteraeota bacterium]|jgi:AcrR family transcriptional regulator|nr:TetR/AcrR family transcriptional regulator [Candidatus Dormibacteraeota bacterium]